MRKRRLSDEQVLRLSLEPSSGESVSAICRRQGIGHQAFDAWSDKYAQALPEFAELRQLREENAKLRSQVVKLSRDRQILKDILARKQPGTAASSRANP